MDTLAQKVIAIIERETSEQQVTLFSRFEDMDIDSLEFINAIQQVGNELHCDIPDSRLTDVNSVGDLVNLIVSLGVGV